MKSQAVVVLSGGITPKGILPSFVKARLDAAYRLYSAHIVKQIYVSGKYASTIETPPRFTESEAMKAYLIRLGVVEKKVITENQSQDMISALYFLKTEHFIKNDIHSFIIIVSDFQKDRTKYVAEKIFGPEYDIQYSVIESKLPANLAWDIFVYEKHILLRTRIFLRKTKTENDEYLKTKFFSAGFYKERNVGYIKQRIFDGRLQEKKDVRPHYSLTKINRIKKRIFEKYDLTDIDMAKNLEADFWSGSFLNFIGRDKNDDIFIMKFALFRKKNKDLSNEIVTAQTLNNQKYDFTPHIVEQNLINKPAWYFYKIVQGRIAGKFSVQYSFSKQYYHGYIRTQFIDYLEKIRSIPINGSSIPRWNSVYYARRFDHFYKIILTYPELASSSLLFKARDYFSKKNGTFDRVKLYPTHNDLHPANQIVSISEKRLYFIDFGHVSKNNIAADFCFAYIFSWDNPQFQKKLYDEFVSTLSGSEKSEFLKIFPLTYMYFLVWLLSFVRTWKGRAGNARYTQAKSYIFTELKSLLVHLKL
ncbi:MAG: YdcF family protein [Candidatus Roizmanbacteria bacterium]|nr:YdcF family protein [Candidatus Roizmanbacteria bacterium]